MILSIEVQLLLLAFDGVLAWDFFLNYCNKHFLRLFLTRLVFNQRVDRKRTPYSHTLFPIDIQRIHLLLQIRLKTRFGMQQLLVLGLGVGQLTLKCFDAGLDFVDLLNEPNVGKVSASEMKVSYTHLYYKTYKRKKMLAKTHLHCSMPAR